MRKRVLDLCLMAMMGVILTIAKQAMSNLPNLEPVTLLVILFTLTFRKRVIGALLVFLLGQGLIYGFHIWWAMYLYVWPLLALLTWLFRWMTRPWQWAVFAGLYGLAFGSLCALVYLPNGLSWVLSWIIAGAYYDLGHAVGNFLLTLVLYLPLRRALDKLVQTAGIR